MNRGAVAEIHLQSLEKNLEKIRRFAGSRAVIAVVKADAYGHGAVEIAKKLLSLGVTEFAVAFTEEAKALRNAGIRGKILVLFDNEPTSDYFEYGLIPVIHCLKSAISFSKEARRRKTELPVHLKIDTGMGRVGFAAREATSSAMKIARLGGLSIEGLLSHFSEADLSDRSFAVRQIECFNAIRRDISGILRSQITSHMGNSAAILTLKDALFDAVRPGIMLYGYSPLRRTYGLKPLMRVKTSVLAVRQLRRGSPVSYGRTFITARSSRIAVLPVGYADGFSRSLSNRGEVLIRGRRAPVVGRVCMDLTMVDVTDIPGVSEKDEVVLLGDQGKETITAWEHALKIDTIPYEIVLALGSRARREYLP